MVAGGGEGIGHALEQILAVMLNERGLAVHHAVVDDDVAAEDVADPLVPKADAKQRDSRTKGADDLVRQPRFARRARSRGNQDALGGQRADLLNGNAVVAVDLQLHLHLPQVLHQVVGEGVVVINDQHHIIVKANLAYEGVIGKQEFARLQGRRGLEQIRSPKAEIRKKPEIRRPNPGPRAVEKKFRAESGPGPMRVSRLNFRRLARRRLLAFSPEQLQLRLLEEVVVLEDANDLEEVGLLVVAVDFGLVYQVGEHGAEGDDRVNALGAEHSDAPRQGH